MGGRRVRDARRHVRMVREGGRAPRRRAKGIQSAVGAIHTARQTQHHRGCAVEYPAVERAFWKGEGIRTALVRGGDESDLVAQRQLVAATEAHVVRDTREQPDLIVRLEHAFEHHLDVRWRRRWRRGRWWRRRGRRGRWWRRWGGGDGRDGHLLPHQTVAAHLAREMQCAHCDYHGLVQVGGAP